MKIKSITVGGFKNLKKTRVSLDGITAIISINNYGKSNLLEAIDFGCDFIFQNPRERKTMMRWSRAIPINKKLADNQFFFEIEFENEEDLEYRFVRYGYSFEWFRDDRTGQRITDEWIDARPNESVRYTSFLKRDKGQYRRGKDTQAFRKINLTTEQLSIDVLSALEDIEISSVISSIKSFDYHICSSLDLRDRFTSVPIEYVGQSEDDGISFDDKDVPRALYQLMQSFPEKYNLFLEAVYSLFPEFTDVKVLPYEVRNEIKELTLFTDENSPDKPDNIPFRIRDELYKVIITHRYLNQPIDMAMMSTGTKRVFWLLANVFIASSKNISLIGIEELETSIHPRLLKKLLEILDEAIEIDVGIPSNDGTALFKKVDFKRAKALLLSARDMEMTVGEYLFELLSGDQDSAETLSFYLED